MGARSKDVKGRRPYDASKRQARALEQRRRVLEVARARFLENGYAATTVDDVAQEAGVSAATIYKSHGGKAGLIRELCQVALEGGGPIPAEARSDALRAVDDPRVLVEGWAQLVAEVSPRLSPLVLVLRAAADADAEAAQLFADIDDARLVRMADNARHLARSGYLREGRSVREARDVLWLCSSPELYDLLLRRRRWSHAAFARFISDTMAAALLA